MVGNHDADGIDVISIDDRLPAALRPFEAVAIFSVAREVALISAIATKRTGGASIPKTVRALR
jgi:hypothetical protein